MASAAGVQGADSLKLADTMNIVPTDFLNDLNSATSSATSGLTAGDWGTHTSNINVGGGASLSIKQVLLWGGVALLGFWLFKKIRKGGK